MKNKLQIQVKKIALAFSMILLINVTAHAQCPLPGAIGSITGDSKACPGDSKPYTNGVSVNATSYLWTLPAGCTIAGQNPFSTTSLSVTVDFGIGFTPPGTILVQGVNACGNGPQRAKTINPNSPAVPGNISGSIAACPGDINTYSVTAVAGITNNWTVPGTMTINSGQGTNSVDVEFLAGFITNGTISVTASNACGTSNAKSLIVWKTNGPPTPTVVNGPDVACPNETKTYSVPSLAGVNYEWEVPVGASLVGQGTTTVDVTFPANFVSGPVRCRYVNNCGTSAFQQVQVRATPTIPGLISGFASGLCSCTATYSVAPIQGATSYNWTPPAGASVVSGQGTNTVDISFGASVTGVIAVNCTNVCGTSPDRNLAVTSDIVIAQQPQDVTICEKLDATISVDVPGCGLNYQWRKDGVNLSDNADFSGTATATLNIISADSLIDEASYDVVISSACASSVTSSAATLTVNMRPPTPDPITAPEHACPGMTGIIASVPAGGFNTTSLLWSVNPDATITSGQGTNSITLDFGPTNNSTYQVTCKGVNACGSSFVSTNHLFRYKINTPGASGPNKVCAGQTGVVYSSPVLVGATGYLWTVTSGMTIASGQGTNSITVDFDLSFVSGLVCSQASTPCFTTPFHCNAVILDKPNVPSPISGQTSGVCGSTLTYSTTPAQGANSYIWTPPAGATVASGQGTTSVDIDFGSFTGTGQVCVQSVGNCVNSNNRCLNVKANANIPGPITPSTTTFCANQTGNTFSISSVTGATSYLWTAPNGATITSGQGTTSVTVDLGTQSGFVKAKSVNACGTSQASSYQVTITCRQSAEDIISEDAQLMFEIYPNPASNSIFVSYDALTTGSYVFEISDVSGRAIITETKTLQVGLNEITFDISNITTGLYLISAKSEAGIQKVKFVKQ